MLLLDVSVFMWWLLGDMLLPLSKGRGECMLLLDVSVFMWWLLGDMLLPLSKGRGECILLLGVSVFMWLLVGMLFCKRGFLCYVRCQFICSRRSLLCG